MLASPDGELRLVASSSEAMRVLEVFELQTQEGPCLDAYRTGERVEHENLRAGTGRWPRFATVALEAGFRSAFALPLRLRDKTIGAMNLFHVEETPMDERDVIVAQRLRRPGHHQRPATPCRYRDPTHQRAARRGPVQPDRDRTSQRRHLRT